MQLNNLQHIGFYFSGFSFKFNPKYMNLSMDMSIYKTNTKKHPIYMVPEARIEIFEDIPRLHVDNYAVNRLFAQCHCISTSTDSIIRQRHDD